MTLPADSAPPPAPPSEFPAGRTPVRLQVRLELAPPPERVELFGELGDWLTPRAMQGTPPDFETTVDLPAGIYAYKLRVDGVWMLDPGNPRTRSVRGDRNSLLVVGGSPEPVLFAPALPFAFVDEGGALQVTAALRKGNGDSLIVLWAEDADDLEHRSTMQLVSEEDEHLVLRAVLPVSTPRVRVRFELGNGIVIGDGPGAEPFLVVRDAGSWPSWWPGSLVYTIFVDRFRPAVDHPGWGPNPGIDASAGGHLEGIRRSLDELRELGVNVIYLTPVHLAATCHRYDVVDPQSVDPSLGGEAALRALLDDAHARGMRVLLDFSFAHAGRGFAPLDDVLEHGLASRHAPWFLWDRGDPPSLRHYGRRTDAPLFDLANPDVRAVVLDTAEYWSRFGIDGFRLDAAAEVPHDLAREVRRRLRSIRPDALVLGEVVPAHAWRWRQEGSVDVATDFGFHSAITEFVAVRSIDAAQVAARLVQGSIARGGPDIAALRFLSTHDHPRFATLAHLHHDRTRVALGLLLLATSPGVPGLLYGEELGLAADVVELEPEHAWQDRAPMPWDRARRDEHLRALVKRLFAVRARSRALLRGELAIVFADGPVLVFRRSAGGETVDVAVNASDDAVELDLQDDHLDSLEPLATVGRVHVSSQTVSLGANAGIVARRSVSDGAGKVRRAYEGNAALAESEFRAGACAVHSRPRRLDFSLTERCNLRCRHCINDSPHRTGTRSARSMTEAVLDRLRDDLVFADYFGFVHGGESLLSPLFFDVLQAIREQKRGAPCVVHLLSNGMLLTAANARRFVELGGNSISVSLDGATARTNDVVRAGCRFDRVVDNLRDVVRLRRELGLDVRLGISCVVMRSNVGELTQLVDLAADLGVDWVKLEELVAKSDFSRSEALADERAAEASVRAAIERGRTRGLVMVDHVEPPVPWRCRLPDEPASAAFLAADEFANRSRIDPCRAPWEHACIDPNGDVRVADFWGPVVGNVMEAPLSRIWGESAARSERERSISVRPCGSPRAVCERIPR